MAMTPLPPLDPSSATFRADVDAFFRTRMPAFISEANATQANMNSIAVGGGFSLPYIWGPGNNAGKLCTSAAANELSATAFDIHKIAASGLDVSVILQQFVQSSSAVKGQLRITKVSDPIAQLVFNVFSLSDNGIYVHFDGAMVFASSANPFASGDNVILTFTRTGDKGDTSASLVPVLWVREEFPSNTSGSSPTTGYNIRQLNTTIRNTLGASLSSNRFTLPVGTYRFRASAPASGVGVHQIRLFNITGNFTVVNGSSEYSAGQVTSRSIVVGDFNVASPTVFELQHWCGSSSGTLRMPIGNPYSNEIYAEIYFEKIA